MSRHATRQVEDRFRSPLWFARDRAGLTQEQLARQLNVTLRTMQRWEDGSTEPKGSQAVELALALEVDVADLYPPSEEAA